MKRLLLFKTKVLYILGAFLFIWGFRFAFSHIYNFRYFYVSEFYPWLSEGLRRITGWFPFSFGDILYILAIAWLLTGTYTFIKNLVFIKKHPFAWLKVVLRFIFIVLITYCVFLIFWGFNYRYNRMYADFGIDRTPYSVTSLKTLCDTLIHRINIQHRQIAGNDSLPVTTFLSYKQVREDAVKNYKRMADENGVFRYHPTSIKPSIFGYLMNFAGVTGYYNPFTGEAQVNTTPWPLGLPFTTCHEMAHQIGFAAEEDANFIGFLTASTSPNKYFRYSANFSIFLYAINALSFREPEQADSLWNTSLTKGVRKDYDAYFAFYRSFKTRVKPLLDNMYDQYLKANEQKQGIQSYRGVVSLLLSYQEKYGKLP